MEQVAFKELNLLPHSFYALTPREFDNLLKAMQKKKEEDYKSHWEHSRFLAYHMIKPSLKRQYQKAAIKDVIALPWDGDDIPDPVKKEQKDTISFWERVDKKRNKDA